MNERDRLFRRFDRIQKLDNPVSALTAVGVSVIYLGYRLIADHVFATEWLFTRFFIAFVFAKLVFALWSARLASAMQALGKESLIPVARATQVRRRSKSPITINPSNVVLPPPLVSQQPAWGDTSVQDGAVIGRRTVDDGTSARTEPS